MARRVNNPSPLRLKFSGLSALIALAKSALGGERQAPKSSKNSGFRVLRILKIADFAQDEVKIRDNMRIL